MSLRLFIQEFYRIIWEEKDSDAIEKLLIEQAPLRGLEELYMAGQRDFVAFHRMVHAQLDELKVELTQIVEQDEWVACRLRIRARDRASGRPIDATAHTMARIVDGQVAEGYNLVDFMSIFQQMGRLPERVLDHCLLGGQLEFQRPGRRLLN